MSADDISFYRWPNGAFLLHVLHILVAFPSHQVFHEGLKSWSCCKEINKPVLEFDEFVKIPVSLQNSTTRLHPARVQKWQGRSLVNTDTLAFAR